MTIALELSADTTAIDTLRRARRLAVTDQQRLRLGVAEVWLLVKFGLPDDLRGLASARILADSLLRRHEDAHGAAAELLAPLAVLIGKPDLAAALANAGALMRALALRAQLARQADDAVAAQRWVRPLLVLWNDAEPSLHSVLSDARRLSDRSEWGVGLPRQR